MHGPLEVIAELLKSVVGQGHGNTHQGGGGAATGRDAAAAATLRRHGVGDVAFGRHHDAAATAESAASPRGGALAEAPPAPPAWLVRFVAGLLEVR